MASAQTILAQLNTLNQVYQRNIQPDALKTIASVWFDALRDMDDQLFIKAVDKHCGSSPYWPTPAVIRAAAESFTPNRPPVLELEAHSSSPEERQKQAVCGAMMQASLAGDARARAFFSGGDWESRDELARDVLGYRYPKSEPRRVLL